MCFILWFSLYEVLINKSFYNIIVQVVFDTALHTELSYHKRKFVASVVVGGVCV